MKGTFSILCAIALFGCDRGESLELRDWTFTAGGTVSQVRLPAHPAVGNSPYALLQQTVVLPPALQGDRLTLAFDKLPAPASLTVNGVDAPPLETGNRESYRVAGPQSWRIPATQTASGTLALELTLANTWTQSAWLDVAPRLSATDGGDGRFRALRRWNLVTAVLGLVAAFVAGLLFLSIFFSDRRRHDAGWFAVEAICGALYPALNLDLLQPLVGDLDVPIAAIAVAGAGVAGVYMMHAFLGRGRPHPAWKYAWFAHACLSVVARDRFHATQWSAATAGAFLGVAAIWQAIAYARAAKQGIHGAAMLSASWLGLFFLGGVDILAWMSLGRVFGGWQGAGIGIFCIALAEAFNLSREHVRALAHADSLNKQLQARLEALEASHKKVGQLDEELRHQLRTRTRELAEGFTQQASAIHTEATQLSSGDLLSGRYRIESMIGSGGMGVVYRATRLTDSQACALKVIKHARSPQLLARMSREALALADIAHPNVVRILDIDVSGSWLPFIVMELIDGVSLADRPDRYGNLAFGLAVLSQTAEALAAVHQRNFVHRDLEPGNIIILDEPASDPLIKVVDFGLAGLLQTDRSFLRKLATTGELSVPTRPPKPLTETGVIFGTPMYMAPEYVAGTKEIGPPADIFSLGLIAYEVLGRQKPFRELPITAAVHGRPLVPLEPLESLCRGLSPQQARLILRCLSANPTERPTAAELAEALRDRA